MVQRTQEGLADLGGPEMEAEIIHSSLPPAPESHIMTTACWVLPAGQAWGQAFYAQVVTSFTTAALWDGDCGYSHSIELETEAQRA